MYNDKIIAVKRTLTTLPNYEKDIKNIISVITNHDFGVNGSYSSIVLLPLFKKNGWGRRSAVGFIELLLDELNSTAENTDIINDDLDNLLTNLLGNCRIEGLFRFFGDPDNSDELIEYIASGKWLDEEFYTGTL